MAVRKTKLTVASPIFEKLNQQRLQECGKTVESVRRTIEASKRLTEQAHELIRSLQSKRKKAG